MSDTLNVSEIFGPTIQGEGPSCGTPAAFIRLWGCNLDCSWCDTPYTWDVKGKNGTVYLKADESTRRTIASLVAELPDVPLVVISGGEPLVQAASVVDLVFSILESNPQVQVEIETNGTRPPPLDHPRLAYNVSPKLAHADTSRISIVDGSLAQFEALEQSRVIYKFVAATPADVAEAADVATNVGLSRNKVWIMPEGITEASIVEHSAGIIDAVIAHGLHFSTRLHVLLWGNVRGV